MKPRAEVVAEARTWLGTPWQHQAHARGLGCDCAGLIRGVLIGCGLMPPQPEQWPGAAPYIGYRREPDGDSLVRACAAFLPGIAPDAAQAADVVVMRFRHLPQHLGILVPYLHGGLALLHATNRPGVNRVVEHRLDARWRSLVTHAFAMPGVG
ncbi:MAG: hypothetical protein V4792_16590 [Pseudomonadota bacterium]